MLKRILVAIAVAIFVANVIFFGAALTVPNSDSLAVVVLTVCGNILIICLAYLNLRRAPLNTSAPMSPDQFAEARKRRHRRSAIARFAPSLYQKISIYFNNLHDTMEDTLSAIKSLIYMIFTFRREKRGQRERRGLAGC